MFFRIASVAALAASVSMIAAPVGATSLPKPSSSAAVHGGGFDANSVNAEAHRRWRHRDRVDAGDVIAGVAVIGVIAAIAGAANQSSRNSDYRYPQRYPYPDRAPNYRTDGAGYRYGESGGLDRAADMCAREVERSGPVDAVESVNRTGSGWQVSGRLRDGARFNCSIGNDGRIEGVNIDRYGSANGGQWDDERYAAARQAQGDPGVAEYPGGPIGNEASDDRYDAGQVPDYPG